MADPFITKRDAVRVVLDGLSDLLDAAYLDAAYYVDDHGGDVLDDDELDKISGDLGAEVEGIILGLIKATEQYRY